MSTVKVSPRNIWELAFRVAGGPEAAPVRVSMSVARKGEQFAKVAIWSRRPVGAEFSWPESIDAAIVAWEAECRSQEEVLPEGLHVARLDFHDPGSNLKRFAQVQLQGQSLELGQQDGNTALKMAEQVNALTLGILQRTDLVYGSMIERMGNQNENLMRHVMEQSNTLISTMKHLTAMLGEETKGRYEAQVEAFRAQAVAAQVRAEGEPAEAEGVIAELGKLVSDWHTKVPENVRKMLSENAGVALELIGETILESRAEGKAAAAALAVTKAAE